MTLGEKIRQARHEQGLSQRQLCGEQITRNMLSQIENGTARPSMDTLLYLAGQLGKPASYFLEDDVSPNERSLTAARTAYTAGGFEEALEDLAAYRGPDPLLDPERWLLEALCILAKAELALEQGRKPYAAQLLAQAREALDRTPYANILTERLLLLAAKIDPEAAASLPSLDEPLCLQARTALASGAFHRAAALLDAVADRSQPLWHYLRGEVYLAQKEYLMAANHFHLAQNEFPQQAIAKLEICYRELGDFKRAYEYACMGR